MSQDRVTRAAIDDERRDELNRILYESQLRAAHEGHRYVTDYALTGLRSLLVAHGGALVALLAFVANELEGIPRGPMLAFAFWFFVGGLLTAFLAVLAAYYSQGFGTMNDHYAARRLFFSSIAATQRTQNYIFMLSLVRGARDSEREEGRFKVLANILAVWAVVLAIASAAAFLGGAVAGAHQFADVFTMSP